MLKLIHFIHYSKTFYSLTYPIKLINFLFRKIEYYYFNPNNYFIY